MFGNGLVPLCLPITFGVSKGKISWGLPMEDDISLYDPIWNSGRHSQTSIIANPTFNPIPTPIPDEVPTEGSPEITSEDVNPAMQVDGQHLQDEGAEAGNAPSPSRVYLSSRQLHQPILSGNDTASNLVIISSNVLADNDQPVKRKRRLSPKI